MPRGKKIINDNELCKYNPAVECLQECRNCDKCGWNPNVAWQRKQEQIERKGE